MVHLTPPVGLNDNVPRRPLLAPAAAAAALLVVHTRGWVGVRVREGGGKQQPKIILGVERGEVWCAYLQRSSNKISYHDYYSRDMDEFKSK